MTQNAMPILPKVCVAQFFGIYKYGEDQVYREVYRISFVLLPMIQRQVYDLIVRNAHVVSRGESYATLLRSAFLHVL
jgi:hypothetical protein